MRAAKELFHALNDFLALLRRIYSILFAQLSIVFEYCLALLSHERLFVTESLTAISFSLSLCLLIWFLIRIIIPRQHHIIDYKLEGFSFSSCKMFTKRIYINPHFQAPKMVSKKKLYVFYSMIYGFHLIWKYRFSHFLCTNWFIFQHFVESQINTYKEYSRNRFRWEYEQQQCLILVNLLTL